MNVQERLLELMSQRNWTAYKLAKQADLSETTISNMFKRDQMPTLYTLGRICDAFGITLSQFFAEGDDPVTLSDEQKELLTRWNRLSPNDKQLYLDLLRSLDEKK